MADNMKNWQVSSLYTLFTFSITYSYTHVITALTTCYLLSPVLAVLCEDMEMNKNGKELALIENLVCAQLCQVFLYIEGQPKAAMPENGSSWVLILVFLPGLYAAKCLSF